MIGVVHLVWAPLGPEPLRAFLRSYREHDAGAEHELVVVLNGAGRGGAAEPREGATHADGLAQGTTPAEGLAREAVLSRETLLAELRGIEHRLLVLAEPLLDLAAYDHAARGLDHERLCFLNSYSVILAEGWLAQLARAAELPGVGVAGASGSWESQAQWGRGGGGVRERLRELSGLRTRRSDFPAFPNPHLRTTAFLLRRELFLQLGLERAREKYAAYLLESGRGSLTRQLQVRGLRAVVVGRDGCAYEAADWARSRTFRSGEQENLLVADNRTEDWQRAPLRVRRGLTRDAWGRSWTG